MKILLIFIILITFFAPRAAFSWGFFEKHVSEERKSWDLFQPDDLLVEAFPVGNIEEVQVNQQYHLEINIPALHLFLYKGRKVLKQYPIAVGAINHKTPTGKRFLKEITWNPWWYPPTYSSWARNAKPEPPGPNNPLGPVKMSLGGDILLHGTNKEWSVGHAASHGCMRMKNRDARELAWFFQKQLSTNNDESLLAKYGKIRWQSFPVKLAEQIPVNIIYDRVALVDGEEIEIFPDVYGVRSDLKDQIVSELMEIGLNPWDVDTAQIDQVLNESLAQKIRVHSLVKETL